MHIWTDPAEVPESLTCSVVTIGNFDGVHRGHMALLDRVVKLAAAADEPCMGVVMTFSPHPATVHRPAFAPVPIMADEIKDIHCAEAGIDAVLRLNYTWEFAQQTPEEFIKNYVVDVLHARAVVVGEDVRFGLNNEGDINVLRELGEKFGFEVVTLSDVGEQRRWSSTWVREALQVGDVKSAAEVLGRNHRMYGTVVHGFARGRELGFPTANLSDDATGLMPADGVYAGWLIDKAGVWWPSAISIGTNPTFDGVVRVAEAFVMDRPEGELIEEFNLYDQKVVLEFVDHLRPTVTYRGPEALIEQMHLDVERAREILRGDADARPEVVKAAAG